MRNLMRIFLAAVLLLPSALTAEPRKLSGAEIKILLPTITAYGEDTKQTFYKGGTTDYISSGRPSVGYWNSNDTQYCSKWPPFGGWACYDVLLDEETSELFWIGDSGEPTVNRIEVRQPDTE